MPSPHSNAVSGTLISATPVGDTVRLLRIARPSGFEFQPGQAVKLGLPNASANSYSIASAPHEPALEFCVERVPGGRLSPRLYTLQPGQRVTLGAQAKGSFTYVQGPRVQVMVATVTGIAPFRSMVRSALHHHHLPPQLFVLHGASYAAELVYREEFEELARRHANGFSYLPTVSRPEANLGFSGAKGRVDTLAREVLTALQREHRQVQVYACGNAGMVANVHRLADELGLAFCSETFH